MILELPKSRVEPFFKSFLPLKVTPPVTLMLFVSTEVLNVVSLKLASFSIVILPVLLKVALLKEAFWIVSWWFELLKACSKVAKPLRVVALPLKELF